MSGAFTLLLCDRCVELFRDVYEVRAEKADISDKCANGKKKKTVHACYIEQPKKRKE